MEFIKNNLPILSTIIFAIVSAIFNVYQYFENKLLKRYGTERDLEIMKAKLEKIRNDHWANSYLLNQLRQEKEKKNEFAYEEKRLLSEIEYMKKILKIKKHDNFLNNPKISTGRRNAIGCKGKFK